MRLMILATTVVLATAAGAATPPLAQPARQMPVVNPNAFAPADCPVTSRYEAARRGGKLKRDLLDELPAADMYMTAYRRIGLCEAPIIAGYGFGRQ